MDRADRLGIASCHGWLSLVTACVVHDEPLPGVLPVPLSSRLLAGLEYGIDRCACIHYDPASKCQLKCIVMSY
jgi:hypothetical protein